MGYSQTRITPSQLFVLVKMAFKEELFSDEDAPETALGDCKDGAAGTRCHSVYRLVGEP